MFLLWLYRFLPASMLWSLWEMLPKHGYCESISCGIIYFCPAPGTIDNLYHCRALPFVHYSNLVFVTQLVFCIKFGTYLDLVAI